MESMIQVDAVHGMCYCYSQGAFDAVEPGYRKRSNSLVEKFFRNIFLNSPKTPLWMIYLRFTVLNKALPLDQIRNYMEEFRNGKLAVLDEIKPSAKAFLHRGVALLEDLHTDIKLCES